MPLTVRNYIDGTWVDGTGGARFESVNPATGQVLASVPVIVSAEIAGSAA